MNMNLSLIRHILTGLGSIAVVIGLDKYTGVINYLLENLDSLWAAGLALVGAATTVYGFFRGRKKPSSEVSNTP